MGRVLVLQLLRLPTAQLKIEFNLQITVITRHFNLFLVHLVQIGPWLQEVNIQVELMLECSMVV